MSLDGIGNVEGQGQGGAALFAGDDGGCAGANGVQERFNFETERFAWGDRWFADVEAGECGVDAGRNRGIKMRGRLICISESVYCLTAGFNEENFLPGVVDGDVLVGLEEAQFADALGADAAGGEVGDAAGFEFDADIGDVSFGGEDGQADSADLAHR